MKVFVVGRPSVEDISCLILPVASKAERPGDHCAEHT